MLQSLHLGALGHTHTQMTVLPMSRTCLQLLLLLLLKQLLLVLLQQALLLTLQGLREPLVRSQTFFTSSTANCCCNLLLACTCMPPSSFSSAAVVSPDQCLLVCLRSFMTDPKQFQASIVQ